MALMVLVVGGGTGGGLGKRVSSPCKFVGKWQISFPQVKKTKSKTSTE